MTTPAMILALRSGWPHSHGAAAEIASRLDELFQRWIDHELTYLAGESIRSDSGHGSLIHASDTARRVAARLVEEGAIAVDEAGHWRCLR